MRACTVGAAAAAFVLLCAAAAWAQATGAITGVVVDDTGGVLPGVTIEVVSAATGQMRNAATDADGFYAVRLLAPGRYQVKGSLAGFKTFVREGVTVAVESSARVDITLAIGGLDEVVTVTREAPLVETAHATLGLVIDEKNVVELPLNGRNVTQLGTLLPGVVAPPAGLGGGSGEATPGGFGATTSGFSVNGMRNQSNNFLLDGASNNDTFNTGFVLRPPPDAIQEFKILTHSYTAEYGRSAGSVVNVVTRSGSNTPHGGAWEFARDDALQARNYFAPADQPNPKLQQHQFGGSLGGPLQRNRLFAFGYYEGFRNLNGVTQNVAVPTDGQRRGDFGATTIVDPRTGSPFPGNLIPAERIDPTAAALLDRFIPAANAGADRYVTSPDSRDDRDQVGLRLDAVLSPRHSLLGRYMRSRTVAVQPGITRPIGTEARATLQDVMVSDTFIVSPTAINQARVSYGRIGASPQATSGLRNADFGIDVPHNVPSAQGLANIAITGLFGAAGAAGLGGLGDVQQPFVDRLNEVFQFADDFTWVRGRHALKFGVDVRREHMAIAFVNRPNGDFTFGGIHTGSPFADFLLGLPSQFRRTTANASQDGTGLSYAAYAQDEFRPSAHVTLNIGLRYEVARPFVEAADALNAFRPGQQSRRFPDAPLGLVYPGDPGVPRGTYATDTNNLAPRFGVVWDPTGHSRSSLRAAWGLFYDVLAGQGDFFQSGVLAPPFTPLVEVNAPPAPLTLRRPLDAAGGEATLFPPGLTVIGWSEDFTTPVTQHFNVTWQQELAGSLAAEIGYVGSRGRNLPIFIEVNPGLYTPGQTAPGARLFPAYSLVRPTFSAARSWYDSLQASLRLRDAKGLGFLVSYTLGHAEDHVSGLNIGGEARPVLPVTIGDDASIDRALALERGDALFDVRHRFVASFTAALPTPARWGRVASHLLGQWQVNGIVQAQTGFPFTVTDGVQSIRYLTNRPDLVCDPNAEAPRTVDEWFDTSCFVRRPVAETGEPGNQPRNAVRGPGFARTDLSLFKTVPITGRQRLQLRVEIFNLFDQTRFAVPNSPIGTANFGRLTSSEDGRVVQLALKYNF